MARHAESLIARGREAMAASRWSQAREAFQQALHEQDDPAVRAALAEVMWWQGDFHGTLANLEKAYVEFRRSGLHAEAADAALHLALSHVTLSGNRSAASGWCERAEGLIRGEKLDSLLGILALVRSEVAVKPAEIERAAREALDRGRRSGDMDLELCALSQLGYACVRQGRISEGIRLLDESMAGALAGESEDLSTVVFACCNMMHSCTDCADFERATEWVRASQRFSEKHGCPFLYVGCRTRYGRVLLNTGEWARAEEELRTALRQSREYAPSYLPEILSCLAELRTAQGRLEEAERLLTDFEFDDATATARAGIELQKGNFSTAAALARRRLSRLGNEQLEYACLVEMLGEAENAEGSASSAGSYGKVLSQRGAELGCSVMQARGRRLQGVAAADPTEARRHLRDAVSIFRDLRMPLEVGRTHLHLAHRLRQDEPAEAVIEAEIAHSIFRKLSADWYTDAAAALLRRLGAGGTRPGPREPGELTRREREVLDLLGEGLSNPQIAERLFVSRKTVEHHVAHILAKLGLRNRAEAAAEAVRRTTEKSGEK